MGRNGRITIPKKLREEFGIDDGAVMDIEKKDDTIVLKPLPRLEPGEPVGEEEYKKMIAELDAMRSNWR